MPTDATHATAPSATRTAVLLALSELALTSIHHAYGAYAYATPWRSQVAGIALVFGLIIVGLSLLAHQHRAEPIGRLIFWLNMALILIVPAAAIGLFEGGYNHFLKVLAYFAGDPALFGRMFPSPPYEAPTDWLFEVTGVAQFPLGLWCGWAALTALFRRA